MGKIIVATDPAERRKAAALLEERVYPVYLASDDATAQLIQHGVRACG